MKWEHGLAALGLVLLTVGHGMGLFVAPPEAMMGDVGRIDDHQDVAGFDGLAEFYPHIQHRSLERG